MDLNGKHAGVATPSKPNVSEKSKLPENVNPNVTSPSPKPSNSPVIKSATKSQKSAVKNPNPIASPSPRNKIRERKFVVAKKNSRREKPKTLTAVNCKCKAGPNSSKCLCVAYETLRASQEEFFRNPSINPNVADDGVEDVTENPNSGSVSEDKLGRDGDVGEGEVVEPSGENGSPDFKKRKDRMLEAARQSIPEPGSGRVMHLVKAFENILTLPKSNVGSDKNEEKEESEDARRRISKWELPGLRPQAPETQVSSSSFCPSEFMLTSECLGLDMRRTSSLDSSQGSVSNRTSGGGRRSRRNSLESSVTLGGSRWKKRTLKATSQQPFKLRTEQRGRSKQEEFMKKVQEMMIEQEKQRIPVAQGLPWTTDEPECLVKPPVKESTRPVDLVLHSDVRAVERAEFDHQVQEKLSLIEQYKLERERQQKLAEEEELRRLRKELVPKAQPMPYFDRPFIPRRSEKQPTMPKEPKFHHPQHKRIKSCMSWSEMFAHQHQHQHEH